MQHLSRLAPVIATLCLFTTAASAGTDPIQLLRAAVEASSGYSYVGQVQNTAFGNNRANAVLFRIEHRSPDLTRRWYLAPQSLYGDSIITRGESTYEIDVHRNRILVSSGDAIDDEVAFDDNFNLLLHNYSVQTGPEENVAGRRAIQLLLANKYTGQIVVRLAIDAATKLILERDEYGLSGAVTNQMRFEDVRYTSSLPAQIFDVPSSGYTRERTMSEGSPSSNLSAIVRSAGFQARFPRYLPEGFVAVAGETNVVKGVRTLHLLYSDGLRTVSLFENARGSAVDMSGYSVQSTKVGSQNAQYATDGPTGLLAWADGDLHYELVSEMPAAEMTRIASSVAH